MHFNPDLTIVLSNFFPGVCSCLLYKYLSVDGFPAASGVDAVCRLDNRLPRACPTEQLTPSHPRMAMCSGNDVSGSSVSPLTWPLRCSPLCSPALVLYIHPGRLSEGLCTSVYPTCYSISLAHPVVWGTQKQCLTLLARTCVLYGRSWPVVPSAAEEAGL